MLRPSRIGRFPVLLGRKPAASEVLGGRKVPQQSFDPFYFSIVDVDQTVTPLLLRRGDLLAEPHSNGL